MNIYKAIIDDVTENSDSDAATAFARMSVETVPDESRAIVTEADVIGGLGMVAGSTLLDHFEANLPASIVRVIQSRGIDMAHSESIAQVNALRPIIGDTAADWLIAQGVKTKPKWHGLKVGQVESAFRWHNEGWL